MSAAISSTVELTAFLEMYCDTPSSVKRVDLLRSKPAPLIKRGLTPFDGQTLGAMARSAMMIASVCAASSSDTAFAALL